MIKKYAIYSVLIVSALVGLTLHYSKVEEPIEQEQAFGAGTLQDSYTTGGDSYYQITASTQYQAQTFTANSGYTIDNTELQWWRLASPGTITVEIQTTTTGTCNNGVPSGTAITTGTYNANTLGTSEPGAMVEIDLTDYTLTSGVCYAIVAKCPSCDGSNRLYWYADVTSPAYDGGFAWNSSDSGDTWNDNAADFMFATYGDTSSPCDCPVSGDWYVNSSDNCYLATDCDIDTGVLYLVDTGAGAFNIVDGATLSVARIDSNGISINAESGTTINFK